MYLKDWKRNRLFFFAPIPQFVTGQASQPSSFHRELGLCDNLSYVFWSVYEQHLEFNVSIKLIQNMKLNSETCDLEATSIPGAVSALGGPQMDDLSFGSCQNTNHRIQCAEPSWEHCSFLSMCRRSGPGFSWRNEIKIVGNAHNNDALDAVYAPGDYSTSQFIC